MEIRQTIIVANPYYTNIHNTSVVMVSLYCSYHIYNNLNVIMEIPANKHVKLFHTALKPSVSFSSNGVPLLFISHL